MNRLFYLVEARRAERALRYARAEARAELAAIKARLVGGPE